MSKKILILDFALLALMALGVLKLRSDWYAFGPAHDVALIQPAAQTFPPLAAAVVATPQAGDWTDIPSHNLFSFDRTDIDIAAVVEPEPPKPTGPKPILFGTMIIGKQKVAYVGSGTVGNKSYKSLEAGKEIDTWKIVEIQPDSIVVESNGVRETVKVNDPSAQTSRADTKTALASPTQSVAQASQQSRGATTTTTTTSTVAPPTNSSFANSNPAPIFVPAGAVRVDTLFGGTAVSEGVLKKP